MRKHRGLPHFDPPPAPPRLETNYEAHYDARNARCQTRNAANDLVNVLKHIEKRAKDGYSMYAPPYQMSQELEQKLKEKGFFIEDDGYHYYISWN